MSRSRAAQSWSARRSGCRVVFLVGFCLVVALCTAFSAGAIAAPSTTDSGGPSASSAIAQDEAFALQEGENVSEEAYGQPVPEEGDPYFEQRADDDSWISYINPYDEYRDPYLGDGSGKICATLLNEAGEPIVGESVPNTSVTIPTGDSLSWHSRADPLTVEFPLTENYDRPLVADQFGTDSDLPNGDGYLDSHCLEWHGLPENETIEYGEAEIDGEYADQIEVVGYIQQLPEGTGWDSDIDPIDAAEPYEEAGGGWTYETEASHGQVVVVLQLAQDETDDGGGDGSQRSDSGGAIDRLVGVGVIAALVALSVAAFARYRR